MTPPPAGPRMTDREAPPATIVVAATLGGFGGCVVGAVAGFVGGLLGVDTTSGLAGLAPMVYGLVVAVLGILVGGFVGYWVALRRRDIPPHRASLGLLTAFLTVAGVAALAVTGVPPPVDLDPVRPGRWEWSPWYALAVIVVPGPAALLAHRLGARFAG